MGYFSEKELNDDSIKENYISLKDRLLWRYADLKQRYIELSHLQCKLNLTEKIF